jgi:hypothetical protein
VLVPLVAALLLERSGRLARFELLMRPPIGLRVGWSSARRSRWRRA